MRGVSKHPLPTLFMMKKICLLIVGLGSCFILANPAIGQQSSNNQGQKSCPSSQVNSSGLEILQKSCEMSIAVREGMTATWELIINSSLFAYISWLGVMTGFFGIGVWLLKYIPDAVENHFHWQYLLKLGKPILIIALFGDPNNYGSPFGKLILESRAVVFGVNHHILTAVYDSYSGVPEIGAILNGASAKVAVILIADNAIDTCPKLNTNDEKGRCFGQAENMVHNMLKPYFNSNLSLIFGKFNWARQLHHEKKLELEKALNQSRSNQLSYLTQLQKNRFNSTLDKTQIAARIATGTTFLYVLEIALIFTAVLGGLSLGMSLFPASKPAILIWLGMMAGLWMIQLSYSIINLITAIFVITSPLSTIVYVFANVTGFFGIVLAIIIGGGGGLATVLSLGKLANFLIPKK